MRVGVREGQVWEVEGRESEAGESGQGRVKGSCGQGKDDHA